MKKKICLCLATVFVFLSLSVTAFAATTAYAEITEDVANAWIGNLVDSTNHGGSVYIYYDCNKGICSKKTKASMEYQDANGGAGNTVSVSIILANDNEGTYDYQITDGTTTSGWKSCETEIKSKYATFASYTATGYGTSVSRVYGSR